MRQPRNEGESQLPPPLSGQPGPFSLGGNGVLEAAYQRAGFRDVRIRAERKETWQEIEQELGQFESADEFAGPCELVIGVGIK